MRDILRRTAFVFRHAWLFSFCINVLLLISPLYMLQVFDRVITSRSGGTLLMLTLGAAAGLLVLAVLEALRSRLFVQASLAIDALLTEEVFGRLVALSATPARRGSGALRDATSLRQFLTGTAMIGLFDVPWAPFFLLMMFAIHWTMGTIALVGMVLMFGLAWWDEQATRQRILDAGQKNQEAGRFADLAFRNGEVVNALGMQAAVTRRWRQRNDAAVALQSEASRRAGTIVALTKLLRISLQIAMLGAGAYLVIAQYLSSGVMMAATILLGKATAPMESVISHWRQLIEARGAYARLSELLGKSAAPAAGTALPAPIGALVADKVVFSVAPGVPILKGVSFALAPGESLGLIGPSGSGKTTLARVLLGLWPTQQGDVRLDGADIAQWPKDSLGRSLGYLPQDVELLSGSVGDNIARLGEAAHHSAAVIAAAQAAGAHEMILALPNGYDTEIGAGGVALSGGQRQRIGLARAIFGEPRLVVLDEPNAHLDQDGEDALVATLARLRERGATTIVITHKASLLKDVDKVLMLQGGQVALFGPRAEVMAKLSPLAGSHRPMPRPAPERVA